MKNCFSLRLSVTSPLPWLVTLVGLTVALTADRKLVADDPPAANAAAESRSPTVVLNHASLTESSGVAVSRRRAQRVWTHNDSGDAARLFAFDTMGRSTGVWTLPTARSVDWEDLACFSIDGRPQLIVADVGDNDARRNEVQLYWCDEPDPDRSGSIRQLKTIHVRFPDGPCDCEAVAVDENRRQIWLASKRRLPICDLFVVPLAASEQAVTARHIARVAIPMVTGMDISPDSQTLVLGGYFDAFLYRKTEPTEPWATALRRTPQHQTMPPLRQIEAVGFANNEQLWVTSEGRPSKMIKLNITPKQ